jgi:hypothetical protein
MNVEDLVDAILNPNVPIDEAVEKINAALKVVDDIHKRETLKEKKTHRELTENLVGKKVSHVKTRVRDGQIQARLVFEDGMVFEAHKWGAFQIDGQGNTTCPCSNCKRERTDGV